MKYPVLSAPVRSAVASIVRKTTPPAKVSVGVGNVTGHTQVKQAVLKKLLTGLMTKDHI